VAHSIAIILTLSRCGEPRTSGKVPAVTKRGSPHGRRDYHHGDLRSALLDSVGRIVREHGPSFVSVREVARRAQVSHAAPSHHFRNKSGLLTAFAAQGFDRLADTIGQTIAASRAATPPTILAAMGRGYVRFAVENPEHFTIMFRVELLDSEDAELSRASDRAYGALIATTRAAAAEGLLDADPSIAAAAAWSLVHGLATLWLSGRLQARLGPNDPNQLADAVTQLFVTSVIKTR
jgi:AcrR family transcriptional regulator